MVSYLLQLNELMSTLVDATQIYWTKSTQQIRRWNRIHLVGQCEL